MVHRLPKRINCSVGVVAAKVCVKTLALESPHSKLYVIALAQSQADLIIPSNHVDAFPLSFHLDYITKSAVFIVNFFLHIEKHRSIKRVNMPIDGNVSTAF